MKHSTVRRKFLWGAARLKILDRLENANSDPGRRILIKGGTVVSMDAKIGNLAQRDVLIEGSKIKEIAPDLNAAARDGKAITLEAKVRLYVGVSRGHARQVHACRNRKDATFNTEALWYQRSFTLLRRSA